MKALTIAQRVIQLARARFAKQPGTLHAEDDMFEALGIDSVQALDLLSLLEQEFEIELPDYEMAEVRTFTELAEKIAERA